MDTGAESPRVSVVIRSYNRGERLLRAVRSALAQSEQRHEIIVVDDASTDGSAERVRSLFGHLPNLRLIACPVNGGAGAAANVGVAAAAAPLVAFLDSDDEWREDFLRESLAALSRHPTAALSYCDYTEVWQSFALERAVLSEPEPDQRGAMLVGGFIHSMSLVVMHRQAILQLGGFDPTYSVSHDFFLWLQLVLEANRPCLHVPRPMVRHHRSADGVTREFESWWAQYEQALARGYEHPAARPHQSLRARALHNISVGIVTRRKSSEWLARTSGASVTVAVRTRGDLAALEASLTSVLAQTYRHVEILVIDADPGDTTARYLTEREDERLTHVPVGGGLTGGQMLNFALAAGAFELIAFLDAGDRWDPTYLEAQVRAHSFIVGAPLFSVTGVRLASGQPLAPPPEPETADLLYDALVRPSAERLSCYVYKRERLLALGGANDLLDHFEAYDLRLRLNATRTDGGHRAYRRHPPVRSTTPLVTLADGTGVAGEESDPATTLSAIVQGFLGSPEGSDYRHLAPTIFAAHGAWTRGTTAAPGRP